MYESHFGFSSRPFLATPSADCFFPNSNTQKAFDGIVSCIEGATGAALIVGGSGIGKSTLLQAIGKYFQQAYSVVVLDSVSISGRKELLQNILFELGLPFHGMEEGELRLTLMDYLKPSDRCPNGMLLCVDEAHRLPTDLLEELRMITNLVRNGQPRVRLILAGNSKIEELLAEPQLESLSQRVSTRSYLDSMNGSECREYVGKWLESVGQSTESIFENDAIDAVYTATHGIPRLINQVCDHALVLALADRLQRISAEKINEAWSDIQRLPVDWNLLDSNNESTSEHVIEFGELPGEIDVTSAAETGSVTETDPVDAEGIDNQEMPVTDSLPADETIDPGTIDPGTSESETTSVEIGYEGPSNPFAEQFEQEELIVDSFSQIIGHSPIQPNFPHALPAQNETDQEFSSHAADKSDSQNEPAASGAESSSESESEQGEPQPLSVDMNQKTKDETSISISEMNQSAVSMAQDLTSLSAFKELQRNNSVEVDAENETQSTENWVIDSTIQEVTASTSIESLADEKIDESSTQIDSKCDSISNEICEAETEDQSVDPNESQSLSEYLEATRDAISVGLGTESAEAESGGLAADDVEDLEQSELELPESSSTQPTEELIQSEPSLQELEAEISQTVEQLKRSIDPVQFEQSSQNGDAIENDDESSASIPLANQNDDRDMLVVEDEPPAIPESSNLTGSDTVPISETDTPQKSSQARREDYRQLFDRLRNG